MACFKCVIRGGNHHSHSYRDIAESFERFKEQVVPSLEPMEKQLTTITRVLTQLDRHCDEIDQQQTAIEADIRESSRQLQEIISKRQDELINQLYEITRRKLYSLATQRGQIETLQAQLMSCLEFTRESLNTGFRQHKVLVMKTGILNQVRELTTVSQPDIFTLSTEADVVFLDSVHTAAVCEKYGMVYVPSSPDPSRCVATGKGTEEAVVGKKATVDLKAVSFEGEPCNDSFVAVSFEADLVPKLTG